MISFLVNKLLSLRDSDGAQRLPSTNTVCRIGHYLRVLSTPPLLWLLSSQGDILGGLNPTNYQKNGAGKKILVQILSNQSQHKKINQFSPVLALGIKLGCGTNDLNQYVSHLIVYWVSTE